MKVRDNSFTAIRGYDPYSVGLLPNEEKKSNKMDAILRYDPNQILSKPARSLPGSTIKNNHNHKISNNSLIERKNISDISIKPYNFIDKSPIPSDIQGNYKNEENGIYHKERSKKSDDHYKIIAERFLEPNFLNSNTKNNPTDFSKDSNTFISQRIKKLS